MATSAKVPQLVERFCVVCGAGSHRLDWQSRDNPSCDSHTQAEVAAALQAKSKPSPAPVTKPATQPAAPTNGPKT